MVETLIGVATMAAIVLLILLANSYIGFSNMLRPASTAATSLVTA